MTSKSDHPATGADPGVREPTPDKPIDRRNPPRETRFKPGQSGNPRGRPKGAFGRKLIVRKVLLEKREIRQSGSAPPKRCSTLELLLMVLREKAFKGDRRALKTLQAYDEEYSLNPDAAPEKYGFLIIPERLTMEEWVAKYSPKDEPPEN